RAEADRPGPQRIGGEIVWPQPRLARAAPKRRLVDGGGEAAGGAGRQRARVAGPSDIHGITRAAAPACDFDVAANPGKEPHESAREPGHAILLTGNRRAAPLVCTVEKPDAGKAEYSDDRFELRNVGRVRALEPTTRHRVQGGKQQVRRPRQPGHAIIPQRARPHTCIQRMANGSAFAHIHDRNRNGLVHGRRCLRLFRRLNHTIPGARSPRPPPAAAPKLIHWPAPRHYLSLPNPIERLRPNVSNVVQLAGTVLTVLTLAALATPLHAADDFPIVGTYTENQACKPDGSDPGVSRVKIT